MRLLKDPLFRRFVSGTVFASAFIWVAVAFFDVDTEVVRVLFVYSIGFVGLMMLLGLVLSPLFLLSRKKRSSLLEKGRGTDEADE